MGRGLKGEMSNFRVTRMYRRTGSVLACAMLDPPAIPHGANESDCRGNI